MKRNKGITLVALVITIIVMLILVAVTVTVALKGDLFDSAKKAASETNAGAAKEELMSIVFGTAQPGGVYDVAQTKAAIEAAGGEVTGDSFPLTVTYKGVTVEVDGKLGEATSKEEEKEKVDLDKIEQDIINNREKYLALAQEAGQNTTNNTDIGIGTDGKVVNMDNWNYSKGSGYSLQLNGHSYEAAYTGSIVDGKIEGTIPVMLLSGSNRFDLSGLYGCFNGLEDLEVAPEIPEGIYDLGFMFAYCTNLKGTITINSTVSSYDYMLRGVGDENHRIVLKGNCSEETLEAIKATGNSEYITIEK